MSQDKPRRVWPIEAVTAVYIVIWIPYIALTRMLTTVGGKPLAGLQILPLQIMATAVSIYFFLYLAGWWRSAHRLSNGLPWPTRWTALSGLATSLILTTVPLSLTFRDVSIPFAQLLMRGDVLIIAPLVDWLSGRKVRWYSWTALGIVLVGFVVTVWGRGTLHLPLACIIAVVLYVFAYFTRLAIMTRKAKRDDPAVLQAYFVEEQMVSYPATLLLLLLGAVVLPTDQASQIQWGFTSIWGHPGVFLLALTGMLTAIIGIVAALILLNPRENSYCVPLERSSSVLGGLVAAYVLAFVFRTPAPSATELTGAFLLIAAIVLLAVAPRLTSGKT